MARIDLPALTTWITSAAIKHPDDLCSHVVDRAGVSRSAARQALRRLVDAGWLTRTGTRSRPHYQPGLIRQVVQCYPLPGLDEDLPWARDFAPFLDLPPSVRRMVQHVFTELLNNAIDHSDGTSATVSLRQTPSHVQLLVSDDGRGVFDKIHETFAIPDPTLAMLELSKGKLTTQPARHTGRGLFFASRLADVFDLHANETGFQHRSWDDGGWHRNRALKRRGTSVYASISLDTDRTLDSVTRQWSLDGNGYGFERTVVPLRLLMDPMVGLESRAQARRVAARLHHFLRAEVDFAGVDHIGMGFADELFRVLPADQPSLRLVPRNMCAAVAAMVSSVAAPSAPLQTASAA